MDESNQEVKYAGAFYRLMAWILDTIILSVPLTFMSRVLGKENTLYMIVFIIFWWLYTSYSIYKWKGTLGKRMVGLYVLKTDLSPVSFVQASLRYLYSMLIYLPLIAYLTGLVSIEAENEKVRWMVWFITLIPFLMMFFNAKRQTLYDYFAKTVVVESVVNILGQPNTLETTPNANTKPTALQRSMRGGMGIIILIPLVYGILYLVVMYIAFGGEKSEIPVTSVEKVYEYNNTKIDFYKKELEDATAEFIEAEGMYDIFRGDVKRTLSLNCISSFLKGEGNKDWLNEMSRYRDNARNKYANTVERVKKANKNMSYIRQHFHDYGLGEADEIIDDISSAREAENNVQTCNKLLTSTTMYYIFLEKYISNREATRVGYKIEYAQARPSGTLSKSFYKKEMEQTSKWIKEIKENLKNTSTLSGNKSIKLRHEREFSNEEKDIWNCAKKGYVRASGNYKNKNLNFQNEKGQTPLMMAVKNGNHSVIDGFSEGILDVNIKDIEGKTAYDYIENDDKKYRSQMIGTIKMAEVSQIFRDKASILEIGYDNDSEIIKVRIKNAKCRDFNLSKYIQCKEQKL
jgi:uncharacterized RDD family membrane protein YckC